MLRIYYEDTFQDGILEIYLKNNILNKLPSVYYPVQYS